MVQDVIGTAIGGRSAGAVFEGDRSFDIVVRLPEDIREDIDALKSLPVSLPLAGPAPLTVPLGGRPSNQRRPNRISRGQQATSCHRERSGSRHRIRRTRARADRNGRHLATRLLVIVGAASSKISPQHGRNCRSWCRPALF
jgi:hypothetical protein